jgi:hypothetical protein
VTVYTKADAQARAALIEVDSYEIFLDLTAGADTFRSRTEIRFRCRAPGAASYANLTASTVSQLRLNGRDLDPGTVLSGGQLHLARTALSRPWPSRRSHPPSAARCEPTGSRSVPMLSKVAG